MNCENCGKEIPYILVDGYGFGDRLLEGVMFKVEDKNGQPHVIGTENADDYMEDLNAKKWNETCEDYSGDLDFGTCPECKEDKEIPVEWAEWKAAKNPNPQPKQAPRKLVITNFKDILENATIGGPPDIPFMRPKPEEKELNKLSTTFSEMLSNPKKFGLEKFDPNVKVVQKKVDLSKYRNKLKATNSDKEVDDILQKVYAKARRDADEDEGLV